MKKLTINLATGKYERNELLAIPVVVILVGALLLWHAGSRAKSLGLDIERVSAKVFDLSGKSGKGRGKPVSQRDEGRERTNLAYVSEIAGQRTFSWIGALDNLEKAIPPGVSLSSIQPSFKDGIVKLTGYAKDFGALSKFIDNLEGLKVYKRVLLVNQAYKDLENGKEAILFNISIEGGK